MSAGVVFRRIGGRIIPILKKTPPGVAGFGIIAGASIAAPKIRQPVAEKLGFKSGSLGTLGNFTVDAGIATGALYGVHRYGGAFARNGLNAAMKVFGK